MAMLKWIRVSGDCVCDHNFYKGNRPKADSSGPLGFRVRESCGGALQLKDIITNVTQDLNGEQKDTIHWRTEFGIGMDIKELPSNFHAFCLWEPQVANPWENNKEKILEVWRATEPPLGYGDHNEEVAAISCGKECGQIQGVSEHPPVAIPNILVLDDAGLGFRNARETSSWDKDLGQGKSDGPEWVVLKLSGTIGEGDLWKELVGRHREKLVLVVSADQLRGAEVRIGKGLSWEATIEDLLVELESNPTLQPLLEARHLIVTFQSDGAYWLDNGRLENRSSMLVFDATTAEGEWSENQGKGTSFGFMSCFVAAVVRQLCLAKDNETPDFETALAAGLGASRKLRELGHGLVKITDPKNSNKKIDNPDPKFPMEAIGKSILKPSDKFVSSLVPQILPSRGSWMMLDEWQSHARSKKLQRPFYDAAMAVAVLGPKALGCFPVARFGGLQTVDRKEIESLRTLRHLINQYEKSRPQSKPLSIGVFGPPGAGKSFGVEQIAKAALGPDVAIKTFNLSQFNDSQEIISALHQVRDLALSGTTPIIFWDEFDSKGYKWLQYLLAPMQDGEFQDGPITHPIGMSVFIFAGATSQTYHAFGPINPDACSEKLSDQKRLELETNWNQFVLKKGPDFKSRVSGFLNVLGPNPRQDYEVMDGRRQWEDTTDDFCCPIRRALFIRGQYRLKDGKLLAMDPGVLRAMLEIPHYKSGARSLVFLCQQLKNSTSARPNRSDLPGKQLLDMHVDADKFWEICERDLPYIPLGYALAAALHEGYRMRIKGEPDKAGMDIPFDELTSDKKAPNIAQAMRISDNLSLLNLGLVPGKKVPVEELMAARDKKEEPQRRLLVDPENIELMAEAEHNGWMVERLLAGWTYSRTRDNENRKHTDLIPYNQLSEKVKNYDRYTICGFEPSDGNPKDRQFGYIDIVKIAGFRVVPLKTPALK